MSALAELLVGTALVLVAVGVLTGIGRRRLDAAQAKAVRAVGTMARYAWKYLKEILAGLWLDLVEQAFGVFTVSAGLFAGWSIAIKSQPAVPGVRPPAFWSWWAILTLILTVVGFVLWAHRSRIRRRVSTVDMPDGTHLEAEGRFALTMPPNTGSGAPAAAEVEGADGPHQDDQGEGH